MKNESEISFKIDPYWIYLIGFLLILLLPLFTFPPWFMPLDWGKTIVFRIVLSSLFFLFVWQIISRKISLESIKEKIRSVRLVFWLLFSFFSIHLLATIFSLDKNFSLWGDPFRAGGFINFSFYIIFAILIFLIIRQKNWQTILDFSIVIGILVSVVAIFQQFGILKKFFITFAFRPGSTIGNPIFLSTYLLLLVFLVLALGIKSRNLTRKILYFFSLLLFLFIIIILTQTRAAFVGLTVGFLWFLFAYPQKLKFFKVSAGILLIFVIFGMYFLDVHPEVYKNQPFIIRSALGRTVSVVEGLQQIGESRLSAWEISLNALKERPILGYGPENFAIGFNKHYDPLLPRIGASPTGEEAAEWWDRAHNFILDIPIAAGIPALIIYLSLFTVLFWQLQRIKNRRSEIAIISHGIQATFIGYLTANLFSFDTFSTYLISFLLIGYSFHLISYSSNNENLALEATDRKRATNINIIDRLYKYRSLIIFGFFILLLWFIWSFNLKPLKVNKDLNLAGFYSENKKCEKSLEIIDKFSSSQGSKTIIDNYLRMSYVEIIHICTAKSSEPAIAPAERAIRLLKENVATSPYDTRNWLLLAEYTNILIEEKIKLTDNIFENTPEMERLKDETNYYFERAHELSPKRQEIFQEWLKTGLISGDYKKAEESAQKCINLNPNLGECYWLMALTQGYLGNIEKFNHFVTVTKEKGYSIEAERPLQQLVNMYIRNGNYQALAETLPRLIEVTEDKQQKAQLYSSLAVVYLELGQTENARKEALKILELIQYFPQENQAQGKADVEAFLKSLEP